VIRGKEHNKSRGGYLGHAPTRRGLDLALATANVGTEFIIIDPLFGASIARWIRYRKVP